MRGPSDIAGLSSLMRLASTDAAAGRRTTVEGNKAAGEQAFERLDLVLLRRLRNLTVSDAAGQVTNAADARAAVDRTSSLMQQHPDWTRAAHMEADRERLLGLLRDSWDGDQPAS